MAEQAHTERAPMRRTESSCKVPRSLALAAVGCVALYIVLWVLGLRTVVAQVFVRRPRPLSEVRCVFSRECASSELLRAI